MVGVPSFSEFHPFPAIHSPFAPWPPNGQVRPVSTPSFLTLADQVTEHLRSEILRGRWSGALPGKHQLAASSITLRVAKLCSEAFHMNDEW